MTSGEPIHVRLYLCGRSPKSIQAVEAVEWVRRRLNRPLEVEMVDILEQPLRAVEDEIRVTPTLLVIEPSPRRRLEVTFGDLDQLLRCLEVLLARPKARAVGAPA